VVPHVDARVMHWRCEKFGSPARKTFFDSIDPLRSSTAQRSIVGNVDLLSPRWRVPDCSET
jgi:hypothetical protein